MRPTRLLWLALSASACIDYDLNRPDKGDEGASDGSGLDDTGVTDTLVPEECDSSNFPAESIGLSDSCKEAPPGGFTPIVEWDYGAGSGCLSLPVVADIDQDGMPDVLVNITDLFGGAGTLVALRGDGSGPLWTQPNAKMGYGSPPAVADVDGDGSPDIIIVRDNGNFESGGDYTAVMYDSDGNEVWESEHFVQLDFDYATAPSISDMDHDGSPEIILGRVILNADGSTRGVGDYGRGSYGITDVFGFTISESSVSAVTDLDLDGVEEVITGNAFYGPDGELLWYDPSQDDAMIGIANLDGDPEGEVVGSSYNTVRAIDTDGTIMWGPLTIPSANILSVPTIGDIDGDGEVEIIVAGGNLLVALNADGSTLWEAKVHDESGATGASIFDFEGDGEPEVVYIDEMQMIAFAGATGAIKFYSGEHASNTMMDYPVIADVDADDQAEILVCHNGFSTAMSVYGDQDESWMPARKLWNQHPYGISNISDDLSVPVTAVPNFVDSNTWHSAIATNGVKVEYDLAGEILEICEDECGADRVYVTVRLRNPSTTEIGAGISLALYAEIDGVRELAGTTVTTAAVPSGMTSEGLVIVASASLVEQADKLWLRADDDGTGTGAVAECSESDNESAEAGPFCE